MSQKRLIVISSREPFNSQGNSHMHYLDALTIDNEVIFIDPPKAWPSIQEDVQQPNPNLTLFQYTNPFPLRFLKKFFGRLNDVWNSKRLKRLIKNRPFILWQFDPYYLHSLGDLRPEKIVYFPLDFYILDSNDAIFAKRADLLVTVNSLFIRSSYSDLNSNILLLPHGYSEKQELVASDNEKVEGIKAEYGEYFIFTGALTQWNNYHLMHEVAKLIHPTKLLILGEQYYHGPEIEILKGLKNTVFLGHIPYYDLKLYIKNAIACLVMYEFEEESSRNPIKITDYLAQFKVVINTSRLEENEPLENKALYTANKEKKYLEYVQKANQGQLQIDHEFLLKWKSANNYRNLLEKIWKKLSNS